MISFNFNLIFYLYFYTLSFIISLASKKLLKLIEKLVEKGSCSETNTLRTEILSMIFDESRDKNGILEVDCNCNVHNIVTKLLLAVLPSVQVIRKCDCEESNLPYIPVNFNTLHAQGLKQIRSSIVYQNSKRSKCTGCNRFTNVEYQVNPHILFIDVQTFQENPKKVPLKSIEKQLSFSTTNYYLKAVIEFIPSTFGPVGHYVANVARYDRWYCYDDVRKTPSDTSDSSVFPHLLIYVAKNVK